MKNYYVCSVTGNNFSLGKLTAEQAKEAARYWNCDTMCVLSEDDISEALNF